MSSEELFLESIKLATQLPKRGENGTRKALKKNEMIATETTMSPAESLTEAKEYLDSSAAVGQHLADQLLLILGLSAAQGKGGVFRTLPLTEHSLTHIDVLKSFLDIDISIDQIEESNEVIVRLWTRDKC